LRIRSLSAVFFAVFAIAPSAAGAAVPHVVQPGETLWSIAAANNLTTRTVAAFNGLSESSQVVLGSTIMIPSTVEGYAALQRAGLVPSSSSSTAAPASSSSTAAESESSESTATSSAAPPALGGYTVRPGDTLSQLAAISRVPVDAIAAENGLDPHGLLLAGTVIKLPTGAPPPPRSSEPAPAATVVPQAAPEATPTRVGASTVQSVAAANGVSPSLAAAIAWQESGFNNGMVSPANARGVMQVMPGTWDYVQRFLAPGHTLNPSSATDNVTAGVLYLKSLLQQTGGNESAAIAAYYQGLGALRSRGVLPETAHYVANVEALQSRFGG
jgi:soluble lytic murein transglycosylase-like protein